MSDIRSFLTEVMGELAARPVLKTPLDAVTWLGDITTVVAGDDAAAKRRLACRLICLGLPELQDAASEDVVAEIARGAGIALAEMNMVIDRTHGAVVSFDEELLTLEDLAGIGETVHDTLTRDDAQEIQTVTCALQGVVLADPRPAQARATLGRRQPKRSSTPCPMPSGSRFVAIPGSASTPSCSAQRAS